MVLGLAEGIVKRKFPEIMVISSLLKGWGRAELHPDAEQFRLLRTDRWSEVEELGAKLLAIIIEQLEEDFHLPR